MKTGIPIVAASRQSAALISAALCRGAATVFCALFIAVVGRASPRAETPTFTVVGAEWIFARSNQTMIVSAQFDASVPANYYVLRSPDLTHWTTALCWAVTNTGPRQFTLQCPLDNPQVRPYAFLRLLRGPYDADCACPLQ